MQSQLEIFNNSKFGQVRTLEVDGKIFFVASDVAKALGYQRPNDATNQHCRCTVKHSIPHPQSPEKTIEVNVINEGDIYRLAAKSELPSAEEFESWIFDEVLPTIRKTGTYSAKPQSQLEVLQQSIAALVEQERQLKEVKVAVEETKGTINSIKNTMAEMPKEQWRKWVNNSFSEIYYATKLLYNTLKTDSYQLLEERAGADLKQRVRNARRRLEESGATRTAIENYRSIDAIEDDKRLKEIYTAIVKELRIKHLS